MKNEFKRRIINYLKEQGIDLVINEKFNPDIFIPTKKFEKKYMIEDRELRTNYGITYNRKTKNTMASLEKNTSNVTLEDLKVTEENVEMGMKETQVEVGGE